MRGAKLVLLAAAAMAAQACVDENLMLITGNGGPDTACGPSQDTSQIVERGQWDVGMSDPSGPFFPYYLYPVTKSQLSPLKDMMAMSNIEPNDIALRGFHVRILPSGIGIKSTSDCPLSFDWPLSSVLGPGDQYFGRLEILRRCHYAALQKAFLASSDAVRSTDNFIFWNVEVQVFGLRGRDTIESNTFVYPVRVCFGCLMNNIEGNPMIDVGHLPACTAVPTGLLNTGNACNVAQDAPDMDHVVCCLSSDTKIYCPASQAPDAPKGP